MKVKHLDHLNISVSNFRETAAWYGRIFGYEIVEEGTYNGRPWGVLRSGDAMLCAYEDCHRVSVDGDGLKALGLHGINHFALRITDKSAWEDTIRRERLEVFYGGEWRWPHSTAWYVKDPTGYNIEVVLWDGDEVTFEQK